MTCRRTERPGAAATARVLAAIALCVGTALALPASRSLTGPLASAWPAPSLVPEDLALMAAIDRQAPPGPLLATEWVGERMPVLYPGRPQLVTFVQVALHYGTWSGNWDVAMSRLSAIRYLRELDAADRDSFVQVVSEHRPAAIVFRQQQGVPALACPMGKLGYRTVPVPTSEFVVFVRSAATEPGGDC